MQTSPTLPIQISGVTPTAIAAGNSASLGAPDQFQQTLSREMENRQNANNDAAPAPTSAPAPTPQPQTQAAAPAAPKQADKSADNQQQQADAASAPPAPADSKAAAKDSSTRATGKSDSASSTAKKSDADKDKDASADPSAMPPVADMLALVAAFNQPKAAVTTAKAGDAAADTKTGAADANAATDPLAAMAALAAGAAAAANGAAAARQTGPATGAAAAKTATVAETVQADAGAAKAQVADPAAAAAAAADAKPADAQALADAAANFNAAVAQAAAGLAANAKSAAPAAAAASAAALPDTAAKLAASAAPGAAKKEVKIDAAVSAAPTTQAKPDAPLAKADAAPAAATSSTPAASTDTPLAAETKPAASASSAPAAGVTPQADPAALAARPRDAAPEVAIPKDIVIAQASISAPLQQTMAAAAQAANAPAVTNKLDARVGSTAWDQQLGQKIVWMVGDGEQSASLTLNPPDLGPLQVVLNVNKDQATAAFTSSQPEVRQALEAAMPKLRDMMSDAGITLGSATVSTGLPNQQQNTPGDQQRFMANTNGSGGSFGNAGGSLRDADIAPAVSRPVIRSGNGMVDTFA